MDIIQILITRYSDAEWAIYDNEYASLQWMSDTPKPSEAELEALWPVVQQEIADKESARQAAKASAVAKLEALGLTVEEVSVAFGIEV